MDGERSGGYEKVNWRAITKWIVSGILTVLVAVSGWLFLSLQDHTGTLILHGEQIKMQEKSMEDHKVEHRRFEEKLDRHLEAINTKLDALKGWNK